MQTAGLVLDLYDNPLDLKTLYASIDDVPVSVKEAHALTPEEREQLPDDTFALVLMTSDGERLRKYACIDEGNTRLGVAYFLKHGHKLPAEAQRTAAEGLKTACAWYGIDVPDELEKVAVGLGTVATALTLPAVLKGTGSQISNNLAAGRASGGAILTPRDQAHLGALVKGAEVAGTELQPLQDPGNLSDAGARGKPGSSNTSAQKTAEQLAQGEPVRGEQYQRAPQSPKPHLRPHVAIVNGTPPTKMTEKKAEFTAYGDAFPLDSYTQVQTAVRYFDDNMKSMPPEMRHTFAVNMVKRASQMGIGYSEEAAAYGATTFASDEHLRSALDMRRPHVGEKLAAVMDRIYENREALGPEKYCEVLEEFDKVAEVDWRYDRSVLDPYASTYGLQKTAADEGDSWISGNDYITKKQIENYAVTAGRDLRDTYGADFAKEFQKDPWAIFSSLPVEQKKRLARAAGDNSPGRPHDVE